MRIDSASGKMPYVHSVRSGSSAPASYSSFTSPAYQRKWRTPPHATQRAAAFTKSRSACRPSLVAYKPGMASIASRTHSRNCRARRRPPRREASNSSAVRRTKRPKLSPFFESLSAISKPSANRRPKSNASNDRPKPRVSNRRMAASRLSTDTGMKPRWNAAPSTTKSATRSVKNSRCAVPEMSASNAPSGRVASGTARGNKSTASASSVGT